MNSNKYLLKLMLILSLSILVSCNKQPDMDHDHSSHADEPQKSIDDNPELDDHEKGMDVFLSEAQQERAGIKLVTVASGSIPETRRIYGEIKLNEDRVIHQYPKYPGIVRDLRVNIGQVVNPGDTLALIFNTETLSNYAVLSAISGEILEKHAVVGAVIHGADPLLVIGDLSTVWVDLQAFEKDRGILKKGAPITLSTTDGENTILTRISYIKPVMDRETRTYTVRCIIKNNARNWNPGRFVHGDVEFTETQSSTLIVPKTSVQTYESGLVVFIPEDEHVFEAVPVKIGRKSARFLEILDGVVAGDQIVSEGAFFLKSELVTSSFSGHAGHGH